MNKWMKYISILAAILLVGILGGCKDEPKRFHTAELYLFESRRYYISGEVREVELKLMTPEYPDIEIPTEWTNFQVQFSEGTDPAPIEVGPSGTYEDEQWAKKNVTFTQTHDKEGTLILTVHLPENDSSMYRYFRIFAYYGLDYAVSEIIQSPATITKDVMRIRVEGEVYSSEYIIKEDGSYQFYDPEFSAMMARMENEEKWEMCIIESGIVDYVDLSRDDVDEYLTGLISCAHPTTRSAAQNGFQYMKDTDKGYFALFSDSEFRGDNLYAGYDNLWNSYNLPNLKNWNMNDKISSVAVAYNGTDPNICSILTVWDDADFNFGDTNRSKHRMSIIASYWNRQVTVSNLKNVKCVNSSASWNDRMSCISGHFGYWGRSMLDY